MNGRELARADRRMQFGVFGLLSRSVTAFVAVQHLIDPASFRPYFGTIHPLLAIVSVAALGTSWWTVLLARSRFVVYEPGALRRFAIPIVVIPTAFAVWTILFDVFVGVPGVVAVAFPGSIFFYPAMGFVVEIGFHLLPLSLVALAEDTVGRDPVGPKMFWVSVVIVSTLEPAYQLVLTTTGPSGGRRRSWGRPSSRST